MSATSVADPKTLPPDWTVRKRPWKGAMSGAGTP